MSQYSPAMNVLRDAVNANFNSLERYGVPHGAITNEKLQLYRDNAPDVLDALDRLVNKSATITEDQAAPLANYFVDHMVNKASFPTLQDRLMLATYINSCK